MKPTRHCLTHESPVADRLLWVAAVTTFVVGDAVTTAYGLGLVGVVESHPVSTMTLASTRFAGMVAAKAVVIGVAAAFFAHADRRFRTAIPTSLAIFGSIVVGVNVAVITVAVSGV